MKIFITSDESAGADRIVIDYPTLDAWISEPMQPANELSERREYIRDRIGQAFAEIEDGCRVQFADEIATADWHVETENDLRGNPCRFVVVEYRDGRRNVIARLPDGTGPKRRRIAEHIAVSFRFADPAENTEGSE